MSGEGVSAGGFEGVKARLEEIASKVGNDDVPLDEALDLFEEAVSLGMQISDLLEEDVLADGATGQADGGALDQQGQAAQEADSADGLR